MTVQKIFSLLLGVFVLGVCGCALLPHSSGTDAYWGRHAGRTSQASAYTYHITGIIHEKRGDLEEAVHAYNSVIKADESAVIPRLRLLRTQLRLGEYEEALKLSQQALAQIPDSPELWIAFGELNHSQGHINAAVEAFEKAISLRPDDLIGYGALVELHEKANDLVAAIEIYERLIERSPASAALYYQLGINLTRAGDHEAAREAFEMVIQLEPRVTRARFLLGLVLFELEDFQNSAEQLRLYLLERPEDALAQEYRAGALYRLGRVSETRSILERLIVGGDGTSQNHLHLSWIMLLAGETDAAQQFALEGGAYFLADIIFALAALDKEDEEEDDEDDWPVNPWDDRYTIDELEAESSLILATLPTLFGNADIRDIMIPKTRLLSDDLGFSPLLEFFMARLFLYLGEYDEALERLDALRAAGFDSKHIHYHSAFIHDKRNNSPGAERHLRAFLAIDPDNPEVLNFLGYLFAEDNRNLEEAETLLLRALAIEPDNPYYLDSLGWIYYRQGKGEMAADLIRRALYGMDNDDAVLRDHLGDVYLLLGKPERAISEWRRALRLDPALETVPEKIEKHSPAQE